MTVTATIAERNREAQTIRLDIAGTGALKAELAPADDWWFVPDIAFVNTSVNGRGVTYVYLEGWRQFPAYEGKAARLSTHQRAGRAFDLTRPLPHIPQVITEIREAVKADWKK